MCSAWGVLKVAKATSESAAKPRALWWGQAPLPGALPCAPRRPPHSGWGPASLPPPRCTWILAAALPALGTPTPGGPDAPRSSPEESPWTPDPRLSLKPPPLAPPRRFFLLEAQPRE